MNNSLKKQKLKKRTFKWLANPTLLHAQMNHFVGSYWYHLIAFL